MNYAESKAIADKSKMTPAEKLICKIMYEVYWPLVFDHVAWADHLREEMLREQSPLPDWLLEQED